MGPACAAGDQTPNMRLSSTSDPSFHVEPQICRPDSGNLDSGKHTPQQVIGPSSWAIALEPSAAAIHLLMRTNASNRSNGYEPAQPRTGPQAGDNEGSDTSIRSRFSRKTGEQ